MNYVFYENPPGAAVALSCCSVYWNMFPFYKLFPKKLSFYSLPVNSQKIFITIYIVNYNYFNTTHTICTGILYKIFNYNSTFSRKRKACAFYRVEFISSSGSCSIIFSFVAAFHSFQFIVHDCNAIDMSKFLLVCQFSC